MERRSGGAKLAPPPPPKTQERRLGRANKYKANAQTFRVSEVASLRSAHRRMVATSAEPDVELADDMCEGSAQRVRSLEHSLAQNGAEGVPRR